VGEPAYHIRVLLLVDHYRILWEVQRLATIATDSSLLHTPAPRQHAVDSSHYHYPALILPRQDMGRLDRIYFSKKIACSHA